MSGAVSIPLALIALIVNGRPQITFAATAFATLWIYAILTTRKNYQILEVQKPEKKQALLEKLIGNIRDQHKNQSGSQAEALYRAMQPYDTIGELIKFSSEIQTEEDLKWFCDEFERLDYLHPLKSFESVIEDGIKWLPVLREASLKQREIRTQGQFLGFLAINWSGKDKWKQGQARLQAKKLTENSQVGTE